MASYTEAKKTTVKDIIDKYTVEHLDNYVRDTVKKVAVEKMDKQDTEQEVADAVFDCIKNNYSGNIIQAMMCQQVCPTSVLLVLRNEIISTLKQK